MKINRDDDDEAGRVSKTFRRELKSNLVWQRANQEEGGLAVSVKESHLLPQLHGNESFICGVKKRQSG